MFPDSSGRTKTTAIVFRVNVGDQAVRVAINLPPGYHVNFRVNVGDQAVREGINLPPGYHVHFRLNTDDQAVKVAIKLPSGYLQHEQLGLGKRVSASTQGKGDLDAIIVFDI